MTSFILIISKIIRILPKNNPALLTVIVLELLLILVACLYYTHIKINIEKIHLFIPPLIILSTFLYLFYSFKLYSFLPLTLLVSFGLFLSISILGKEEEKSLQYYFGIGLLGVLGGGLITYRFWGLSEISLLLGLMSTLIVIYVSLILGDEDEISFN